MEHTMDPTMVKHGMFHGATYVHTVHGSMVPWCVYHGVYHRIYVTRGLLASP